MYTNSFSVSRIVIVCENTWYVGQRENHLQSCGHWKVFPLTGDMKTCWSFHHICIFVYLIPHSICGITLVLRLIRRLRIGIPFRSYNRISPICCLSSNHFLSICSIPILRMYQRYVTSIRATRTKHSDIWMNTWTLYKKCVYRTICRVKFVKSIQFTVA